MQEHQIADQLSRWADDPASPTRLALLSSLNKIYEADGVLSSDGFAPALHRACPECRGCWKKDMHRVLPGGHVEGAPRTGENGSVFWPWIGPAYRPGGLCLVGLNLFHEWRWWAPLTEEYVISGRNGKQRQLLLAGKKKPYKGSQFWWGSLASAAAVHASLHGHTIDPRPDPRRLVSLLDEIARVQAVKCSPYGDRSKPSQEMKRRCPPRFFAKEINILKPSALLCLGIVARDAVSEAGDAQWDVWERDFQRGHLQLDEAEIQVFVVPHPGGAWARWPKGQDKLVASLTARPGGPST